MMAIVNSAAPAGDHLYPSAYWRPDGYLGPGAGAGASFSTPIVAGAAALMTQAYQQIGWHPHGLTMTAAMLAQGDGYNEGAWAASGVSSNTGFGHLHLHYPIGDGNMTGHWSWGNDVFPLSNGQERVIRIGFVPADVTEWKMALLWNETDMWNAADIDVIVESIGGASCDGTPTRLAAQTDYDLRQRLVLPGPMVANRCIQVRVIGYDVPFDGRTVYAVNYYHGGTFD